MAIKLVEEENGFRLVRMNEDGTTSDMMLNDEDVLALSQSASSLRNKILAKRQPKSSGVSAVFATNVSQVQINQDTLSEDVLLTIYAPNGNSTSYAIPPKIASLMVERLPRHISRIELRNSPAPRFLMELRPPRQALRFPAITASAGLPDNSARWSNLASKPPAPAVAERNSTIRSPISASGISALRTSQPSHPSRASKPRICPRLRAYQRAGPRHRVGGHENRHGENRLQQHRTRLGQGVAQRDFGRRAKRHVGRIHRMIGAVESASPRRRPRESPAGRASARRGRRPRRIGKYWRGTVPPCTFSAKAKPSPRARGATSTSHIAELAVAARLLLVTSTRRDSVADGLAIGDRGLCRSRPRRRSARRAARWSRADASRPGREFELGRFLVVTIDQRPVLFA